MTYIREPLWTEALAKPDWYSYIAEDVKRLEEQAKVASPEVRKNIKEEMYTTIEKAVAHKTLTMATSGSNLDVERAPIDTVVIHHTKNKPGMTLNRLNAMQLLRIYGMYYANPTDPREKAFKGRPIWSGHFYHDKQVFWGYHWLVRNDGTAEHLLKDSYVGWHAGNWDVNCRSIGICIDDDLSSKEPTDLALKAIAVIIKSHYPHILADNVVGHRDVCLNTVCPGELFECGWRPTLLEYIKNAD